MGGYVTGSAHAADLSFMLCLCWFCVAGLLCRVDVQVGCALQVAARSEWLNVSCSWSCGFLDIMKMDDFRSCQILNIA